MRWYPLVLVLFACSAPSNGLHANLSKLRPWSADLSSVQPLPPPFVADFEAGSKSLCYAALEQSNERTSPSLSLLSQLMDVRHYDVVVLEGIPRSLGVNSASLRDAANQDGKEGYFRNGETSVAIAKAEAKKIPFVGAEPDEELIKSAVNSAGYNVQDLFGLYILRLVTQWRRDGTLTRESFDIAFAQARTVLGKRLALSPAQIPTLPQFEKWYEAHMNTPFRVRDIRPETSEPVPDGALFSQKVAAVTDRVRSEHILRVTEEMLNRYGRVFLVFNSVHFPVQEPALESMLGRPVRISDQP
ncbi:MAG: hypothetical protein ACXVB9_20895 [Bdellovibrionota bacterium]